MKKTLIIYCSHTGFTQTYAQWLAEETGAEAVDLKDASSAMASKYDVIVCGGGIYGGEFSGIKKYRQLRKKLGDKTFVYFATGIRLPSRAVLDTIRQNNFADCPEDMLYYFQGGLDKEKLDSSKKTLLVCYKAMLKRRASLSEDDHICVQRLQHSGDYSDKASLQPLAEKLLNM